MIFEVTNPSDPVTIMADDEAVAIVAALFMGNGAYGLVDKQGRTVLPIFAFASPETPKAWLKDRNLHLDMIIETRQQDLIECLRTALVGGFSDREAFEAILIDGIDHQAAINAWNDSKRTSTNDICGMAREIAKALEDSVSENRKGRGWRAKSAWVYTLPADTECKAVNGRWVPISRTTPSGKQQFVCTVCGRVSCFPDKMCPTPERRSPEPEVLVRVSVCVQSDGTWSAAGWSGHDDLEAQRVASETFDNDRPLRWSWVEAKVPAPLPEPEEQVIHGTTTPVKGSGVPAPHLGIDPRDGRLTEIAGSDLLTGGSVIFQAGMSANAGVNSPPPASLQLKADGQILVNGRLAENDAQVVAAFREWLERSRQWLDAHEAADGGEL